MGARFLFIGTLSLCLVPGIDCAEAQTASSDSEVLPAIEVIAPTTSARPAARPARGRTAPRATRNVRRVYVYPTAPTPTAGSGMDVDKVPAAINAVGAAQIARTDSLNIADALQQQVPGIILSDTTGNPFHAGHTISRFRGIASRRHAPGTRGLPERGAHQRSVRRHRQLGPDPDGRDQVGHRRDQQSRVRPQCTRRRRQRPDEGRLQLSRRRNQHDGRLVRTHPEFGAVGQAVRQLVGLWRARRPARQRLSQFFGIGDSSLLWRCRLPDRQQRISPQRRRRQKQFRRVGDGAGRTAAEILGRDLHDAADHRQSRRLRQSDRKGRGDADLDDRRLGARPRAFRQKTVDGNPTETQPCAADPALLCFNDDRARQTASTGSSSPIRSRPTRCWDRSTGRRPVRRRQGRPCRQPTPTSCSGTTTSSWSAPVSIPASPASAPARNWARSAQITSSAAAAYFSVRPASPISIGPVSLRATNQYTGLYALDTFDVTDAFSISGGGRFNYAQHQPSRPDRHRSQRQPYVQPLQSDDRRHLQDHA